MKKIILLLAVSFMAFSCATYLNERTVTTDYLNFKTYSDSSFFISPDPYTKDFESIGELSILVNPRRIDKMAAASIKFTKNIYEDNNRSGYYTENISDDELLSIAVKEAKARGANGLVNYKVMPVTHYVYTKYYSSLLFDYYKITGLCIQIIK